MTGPESFEETEIPDEDTFGPTETSPATSGRRARSSLQRGTLIGRYIVAGNLGAGTMGVVLMAYDPELDRKVALKLLDRGGDSTSGRTRLQREAQALAKLDHPNVVSVFDVGRHDERLFLAMEFVDGRDLRAWQAEVTSPRPWSEVLEVLMAAGKGLSAAHGVGLVHRDFKPANVMLGTDGRVRVMDFGLARLSSADASQEPTPALDIVETSKTPVGAGPSLKLEHADIDTLRKSVGREAFSRSLTHDGNMIGTPAYMSPEQISGRAATAASDQFSFCVTLWESLYGERPFHGDTLMELFNAISTGTPRAVPKGTAVPTWVHSVLCRGLSSEPDSRWPSMKALLDALADDPAIRRRRWLVAGGIVVLLGGSITALETAAHTQIETCTGFEARLDGIWDDDARARVRAAIEGTQLSYAPATAQRVEALLDTRAQQWLSARQEACEATQRGEQSGALLDLRMACLDERLLHLGATVATLGEADASVVSKAVQSVTELPTLERCADADALTAAVAPPEEPEVAEQVAALDARLIEIKALTALGQYDDALSSVVDVEREANVLGYEPLQARVWLLAGTLRRYTDAHEEARETFERAYASALGHKMLSEAADAALGLMMVLGQGLARYPEARRWAKDAEPLTRAVNSGHARGMYFDHLGMLAGGEGKYVEARTHNERALEVLQEHHGADALVVAAAHSHLGVALYQLGDYAAAQAQIERGLNISEQALGPEHPNVAASLSNLARMLHTQGNFQDAQATYERALGLFESASGRDSKNVGGTLLNLGIIASQRGDYAKSKLLCQRSVDTLESALGPEHPHVAYPLMSLGNTIRKMGDLDEARVHLDRAAKILETALGPEHPEFARALNNLGGLALARDDHQEARALFGRSLALGEKNLEPSHPDLQYPLGGLGNALLALGESDAAVDYLERALGIGAGQDGASLPIELADIRFSLARALWSADAARDRLRAQQLAELARAAYAASEGADDEEIRSWQAAHRE